MTSVIPRRRIAGTTLDLPELGFGTASVGNLYRAIDDAAARETLDAAFDAGLRYADTAPYYGFGLAETRLGAAIAWRDAIVSTKVGRLLHPLAGTPSPERHGFHHALPFEPEYDYSREGVLRSHEASLARLGRDRVELLFVHDIGSLTHGDAHAERMAQLLGGGFAALEGLREQGAVDAIGIGVNEIAVCLELMDRVHLDVILLAGRYTLLEQGALDVLLPRCLEEGTSVIVGGPYNSGILAGGTAYDYAPAPPEIVERARRIAAVCARHQVAVGAAALQFVLAHPAVASVIPGLGNPEEVRQAVERYHAPLPPALWEELKAERLLRPDAPTPAPKVAE